MTIKTFRGFVLPIVLLCFCFFTFTRPMDYDAGSGEAYHPTGLGFPFVYYVETAYTLNAFWITAFLFNLLSWITLSLTLFLLTRKIFPRLRFEPSIVVRITLLFVSLSVFAWYFAGSLLGNHVLWGFCYIDSGFWPSGIRIF